MYNEYEILEKQMDNENSQYLNKHVLASGRGLHLEGGHFYGTSVLCHLIKESKNYYMGQWERSIYHHLIFKKKEFQIIKDNLTRLEVLELIKNNPDLRFMEYSIKKHLI